MHDNTIEERLRSTLRREADALPLTITTQELERRLALRRRDRAGRRVGLLAAGIAVIAVGGFVLAAGLWRGPDVATTARPSVQASGLPSAPASDGPVASPQPTPRDMSPLGSVRQAILVGPNQEAAHPALTVSLYDPATDTTTPIANLPETTLPEDGFIDPVDTGPVVSASGYLAIPFLRGPDPDNPIHAIAIVDVRDPEGDPWILDGYLDPWWGPNDQLAIKPVDSGAVQVASVVSRRLIPAAEDSDVTPVWWAVDEGARFIATKGGNTWGTLDASGTFTAMTDLPAAFERTGLERETGVAAHTLGMGCDSGATAGGCVLGEWASRDEPPIRSWFTASDENNTVDHLWAMDGKSVFLVFNHPAVGDRRSWDLAYAATPRARTTLGAVEVPSYVNLSILGIASEPTPGKPSVVAVGERMHGVYAFILDDGRVVELDGTAWFAGWADDPAPYDPD